MKLAILLFRWSQPIAGQSAILLEMEPEAMDVVAAVVRWFQEHGDGGHRLPYPELVEIDEFWSDTRDVLVHVATIARYDSSVRGAGARSPYGCRCPELDALVD